MQFLADHSHAAERLARITELIGRALNPFEAELAVLAFATPEWLNETPGIADEDRARVLRRRRLLAASGQRALRLWVNAQAISVGETTDISEAVKRAFPVVVKAVDHLASIGGKYGRGLMLAGSGYNRHHDRRLDDCVLQLLGALLVADELGAIARRVDVSPAFSEAPVNAMETLSRLATEMGLRRPFYYPIVRRGLPHESRWMAKVSISYLDGDDYVNLYGTGVGGSISKAKRAAAYQILKGDYTAWKLTDHQRAVLDRYVHAPHAARGDERSITLPDSNAIADFGQRRDEARCVARLMVDEMRLSPYRPPDSLAFVDRPRARKQWLETMRPMLQAQRDLLRGRGVQWPPGALRPSPVPNSADPLMLIKLGA